MHVRLQKRGLCVSVTSSVPCSGMHLFMCTRVPLDALLQLIAPGLIAAAKAKVVDFSKWYASSAMPA